MMEIAGLLAAAGATAHRLDPAHQLVAACMRADRATAEALLAADPGLVARAADPLWGNPLLRAAFLGRPDAVVLGVHVGFPLDDGKGGPLHMAALVGDLAMVRLLVRLGADPTAVGLVGDTPGQFAPADPTPAGWAAYNHQHAVVEFLASLA